MQRGRPWQLASTWLSSMLVCTSAASLLLSAPNLDSAPPICAERTCLGVGMLGESPAGSANGRLAAPPGLPKGLLLPLLLLGPKGLTNVLSGGRET